MKHRLDAGPAVGPHLQKTAESHTQPDSSSVAQKDVQYHLVPPTLCKVWQKVHEEQLRINKELAEQRKKKRN